MAMYHRQRISLQNSQQPFPVNQHVASLHADLLEIFCAICLPNPKSSCMSDYLLLYISPPIPLLYYLIKLLTPLSLTESEINPHRSSSSNRSSLSPDHNPTHRIGILVHPPSIPPQPLYLDWSRSVISVYFH